MELLAKGSDSDTWSGKRFAQEELPPTGGEGNPEGTRKGGTEVLTERERRR